MNNQEPQLPPAVDEEGVFRSLKYSTTPIKYLQELTDNSIEHKSTQIQVTLDEFANCYIVEDNGADGIPIDIFRERYHRAYAKKEERTGLGFFGVGSMAFTCISPVRLTITKNHDGFYYSIWDTSKGVSKGRTVKELKPKGRLPREFEKYARPVTRFLHGEEGNGTMVIIPKNNENWGEHDQAGTFKCELIRAFEDRYQHCLHTKEKLKSLVIRRRTKKNRTISYKVSSRNILPSSALLYERFDIKIYTWWCSGPSSSEKKMTQIYLEGVKVGKVDMLKVGSRKKFVPTTGAERTNVRQVVMCPISRMELLDTNPIKDDFGIKKKWVNEARAKMFSRVYEENMVLKEQAKSKQETIYMPKYIKNTPDLCKAIESNNGKFLSAFALEFIKQIKDPKVLAGIPIDRIIERAAKTITQNNGENNE